MGLYYRLILPSCCDVSGSVRGVSRATLARPSVALLVHQGAALVWRFLVCCGSCVIVLVLYKEVQIHVMLQHNIN